MTSSTTSSGRTSRRFGVVGLDEDRRVTQFREKQHYQAGLINGGVYALNRERFLEEGLPEKFSFEKDYLEKGRRRLYGLVQNNYFIDIGIQLHGVLQR
jgi:D-glycero-alpha-D-manno-heptose 1-phosphate guanylyltransferase